MLATRAGRELGIRSSDSFEKIHDRAFEFFRGYKGFWHAAVVATPEAVDVYIIFRSVAERDAALLSAPTGFFRGPAETITAEVMVDVFGGGR